MKKLISNTFIAFALIAALLAPIMASSLSNADTSTCFAAFFPNNIEDD